MTRAAPLGATLLAGLLACASPLTEGQVRYREGDQLAALEIWRSVPPDSPDYEEAQQRVRELETEFEQLVLRHKQRARYFERANRLAESILSYRLALRLRPDDRETQTHVQQLARKLAARKRELERALESARQSEDVAAAGRHLAALRELDPFDPGLESAERDLDARIREEASRQVDVGRRRFQSGDLTGAASAFEAALALEPDNESARGYLSYLATVRRELGRAGRLPDGLRSPDVFAPEARIRAEGLHQNAIAAEKSGDPWAAIRYEVEALRADREHVAARRHLTEMRRRLAPYVDDLIETGRVFFGQEDLQSALDQWRRALLIEPGNERAREYVVRAERMLENLERLRAEPDARRERAP